MVKTYGPA